MSKKFREALSEFRDFDKKRKKAEKSVRTEIRRMIRGFLKSFNKENGKGRSLTIGLYRIEIITEYKEVHVDISGIRFLSRGHADYFQANELQEYITRRFSKALGRGGYQIGIFLPDFPHEDDS